MQQNTVPVQQNMVPAQQNLGPAPQILLLQNVLSLRSYQSAKARWLTRYQRGRRQWA